MRKLTRNATILAAYEAGPCGNVLYRQLSALSVPCIVTAPTLTPLNRKAGQLFSYAGMVPSEHTWAGRAESVTAASPRPATAICATFSSSYI